MRYLANSFDRPLTRRANLAALQLLETRFLLNAEAESDPAMKFYWVRQAEALYKKNTSLESDPAIRRELAFLKWREAEELCKATNARFSLGSRHDVERERLIHRVSRKITKILGPAPKLRDLQFGFGPGASVGVSKNTSSRAKLAVEFPTVSANAFGLLQVLADEHPHWPQLRQATVSKGRLAFVPKTAEIDRSIVVEPLVNTYIQKGIGLALRSRLKRAGCDLDSQETNRDLARFASVTGCLATIDLSSASDTVSKNVVAELLPYDWFRLLSDSRTASVTFEGSCYTLEKFSSMGNGFTFELESLLFFAIAKSVCEDSQFVSVYGDDIVVPTRYFREMVENLQFFGFIVNNEKSFSTGPFRESCGKDYYFGVDVRPVFVKEQLSVRQLFRLHNFFIRRNDEQTASVVSNLIPACFLRIRGPDGFGDGHLLGDYRPILKGRRNGWALKGFRSFSLKPRIVLGPVDESGGYFAPTHRAILYLAQFYGDGIPYHAKSSNSVSIQDTLFQERGSTWWVLTTVYAHL